MTVVKVLGITTWRLHSEITPTPTHTHTPTHTQTHTHTHNTPLNLAGDNLLKQKEENHSDKSENKKIIVYVGTFSSHQIVKSGYENDVNTLHHPTSQNHKTPLQEN